MKSTVIGAAVSEAALRAACTRSDVPPTEVRVIAGRAWVALPTEAMLGRLAKELAVTLHVISVDVSGDVHASRSTHGGVEDDISADARRLREQGVGDSELVWALIDASAAREPSLDVTWAKALLDKLVADGSIELTASAVPIDVIAPVLRYVDRDVEDWLATRLFDALMSSPAIDEVFVDATDLIAVARDTRPRR